MDDVVLMAGLAAALWQTMTVDMVIAGKATHYRPGLMEEVVARRGWAVPEGHVGAVALNRRGDLARTVWLEWVGGEHDGQVDGPFIVVDCAARIDFERREAQRYVVEVAAEVAGARDFYARGPVPVKVWFVEPLARPEGAE